MAMHDLQAAYDCLDIVFLGCFPDANGLSTLQSAADIFRNCNHLLLL